MQKKPKKNRNSLLSHLVIPAADTELSAEAVAGRAVVCAAAVLEYNAQEVVIVRRKGIHLQVILELRVASHLQMCDVAINVHRRSLAVFRDVFVIRWAALVVHGVDAGDRHVLVALGDVAEAGSREVSEEDGTKKSPASLAFRMVTPTCR